MAGIEHVNLDWPILLRPSGLPIVSAVRAAGWTFSAAHRALVRFCRRYRRRCAADSAGETSASSPVGVARMRTGAIRRSDVSSTACRTRSSVSPQRRQRSCSRRNLPRPGLLTVIPNGVALKPVTSFVPDARERDRPIRFGTLGTVKPIKGTDLLVDAFMQFDQSGARRAPDCRLDRQTLGRSASRSSTDGSTHPLHRTFIATGQLSLPLDVFVLPSRSEGMSNALLEAMAAGLPCIATDVGSNRSLLCPPGEPAAGD